MKNWQDTSSQVTSKEGTWGCEFVYENSVWVCGANRRREWTQTMQFSTFSRIQVCWLVTVWGQLCYDTESFYLPVIAITKTKIKLIFIFFLQNHRKKTTLADESLEGKSKNKKNTFTFFLVMNLQLPRTYIKIEKLLTALANKENWLLEYLSCKLIKTFRALV